MAEICHPGSRLCLCLSLACKRNKQILKTNPPHVFSITFLLRTFLFSKHGGWFESWESCLALLSSQKYSKWLLTTGRLLPEFWTFTANSQLIFVQMKQTILFLSLKVSVKNGGVWSSDVFGRRRPSRDGWPLPASVGGLRSVCHARGAELQTHRQAHVFLWCHSAFERQQKLQVQRRSPSLSPWLRKL